MSLFSTFHLNMHQNHLQAYKRFLGPVSCVSDQVWVKDLVLCSTDTAGPHFEKQWLSPVKESLCAITNLKIEKLRLQLVEGILPDKG